MRALFSRVVMVAVCVLLVGVAQAEDDIKALKDRMREVTKALGAAKKAAYKDTGVIEAKKMSAEASKAFDEALMAKLKEDPAAAEALVAVDAAAAAVAEVKKSGDKEKKKEALTAKRAADKKLAELKKPLMASEEFAALKTAKDEATKAMNAKIDEVMAANPEAVPLIAELKELKEKIAAAGKAAGGERKKKKKKEE